MRGGKRIGSGRKKGEGSKMVRVPFELLPALESLKEFRRKQCNSENDFFRSFVYKEMIKKLDEYSNSKKI